jgi:type III pantothenate kinase
VDLVADLGNTRAHVALISAVGLVERVDVRNDDAADLARACDALVARGGAPRRAALVAVNPRLRAPLEAWLAGRGLEALVLGESLAVPLALEVDDPAGVGPDRLADALWAARTYPERAALVVDLGTAITLNVVSAAGAFLGGAIAPGLRTQAWALAQRTARLPLVDPVVSKDGATPLIGKTTEQCIRAALLWGAVGLVDAYAAQVERALGARPVVVATGGDAAAVAGACPRIERVVPDLTLRGLHLALVEHAGGA